MIMCVCVFVYVCKYFFEKTSNFVEFGLCVVICVCVYLYACF